MRMHFLVTRLKLRLEMSSTEHVCLWLTVFVPHTCTDGGQAYPPFLVGLGVAKCGTTGLKNAMTLGVDWTYQHQLEGGDQFPNDLR